MNQHNIECSLYQEDLESIYPYISELNKNATILITGATGLIGSFLIDAFVFFNKKQKKNGIDEKFTIYCMSRKYEKLKERFKYNDDYEHVHYIVQDVCQPLDRNTKYDYIIHAASNADPENFSLNPVETITANVLGTTNILEYARYHTSTKIVFISTREVYGYIPDSQIYNEEEYGYIDFNLIRSGYPESKRTAELLCRSYAEQYQVDCIIARLGYVYGPTMQSNDSRVVAQFLRNALEGQDIIMKSKGEQIRSYCYISDAIAGILKVLKSGKRANAYNIANKDTNISISDMAEIIAGMANTKVIYKRPNEVEERGYSRTQDVSLEDKKLRALGWKPTMDFVTGIQRTFQILNTK